MNVLRGQTDQFVSLGTGPAVVAAPRVVLRRSPTGSKAGEDSDSPIYVDGDALVEALAAADADFQQRQPMKITSQPPQFRISQPARRPFRRS